MDTSTHVVIRTTEHDKDFIVRPVSLALSDTTWMIVAFDEEANDLRTFPYLHSSARDLENEDRKRLQEIRDEREAAVPVAAANPLTDAADTQ